MKPPSRQIVKIVKEICKENNISLKLYSYDWIMQLEINKKNIFIYGYQFQNNNATAQLICGDKSALSEILVENGVNAVTHHFFMSPTDIGYAWTDGNWEKMMQLLHDYGTIVCKDNTGTGGSSVYKVANQSELENAVSSIFSSSRALSISPFYEVEEEYRIILLGDNIELIYQKEIPYVIGDGIHTFIDLCYNKYEMSEVSIETAIQHKEIVPKDAIVKLNWKHNLGMGAIAKIVTDVSLRHDLSKLALTVTHVTNISFASIDIIKTGNEYKILEINSGIMMENFAKANRENYWIAKSIYHKAINILISDNYKRIGINHNPIGLSLAKVNRKSISLSLLNKAAKKRNEQIIMDEEYMNYCIYSFRNGNKFVVKESSMNINPSGSAELARNKAATSYFLDRLGFQVPRTSFIIFEKNVNNTIQKVLKEAENYTFPFILKPNDLSQGQFVYKVTDHDELLIFAREIVFQCEQILLQEYCFGRDYRVVVLGNNILSAYERIPLHITGNGIDTVHVLLKNKQEQFITNGRDTIIDFGDPRIHKNLLRYNYQFDTVISKGEIVNLHDITNISVGGTSRDITDSLSQYYHKLCVEVANYLNLKMCGIDIICQNIESEHDTTYRIIEVNSAPGLDNYQFVGDRQKEYVEDLYEKVYDFLLRQ